jgi:uncharacterized protein YaeQ
MDRELYGDHAFTIARHPSETGERMLIRLLAFALNLPSTDDGGPLEFAKDMWDPDEPALWGKDLTGQIWHWIEVGQPDEKRLMQASSRAARVSVQSFASSTPQGGAVWRRSSLGRATSRCGRCLQPRVRRWPVSPTAPCAWM